MVVASLARRIPSPPPSHSLNTFQVSSCGNWTVGDLRSVYERDVFFASRSLLNLPCGQNKFIPVVLKTGHEVEHSSSSATGVEKEQSYVCSQCSGRDVNFTFNSVF
jgi:hypothetical protein